METPNYRRFGKADEMHVSKIGDGIFYPVTL